MTNTIRSTNLRFNLEKDLQRKAWEYLQTIPIFSGNVPGRKPGNRIECIINLVNHKRNIEILNFKNVKYKS